MPDRVRVAIVGLGFGAEFIPIYQAHPDAEMYAICQRNQQNLKHVGEQFGVAKRYANFDELIKDPNVDAVHINSPIPDHAWMSVKALQAGKHVACTVPMGDERRRVPADHRRAEEERQDVHDDGDGRLQPRVPLREGPVRPRRARADPVPPRLAPAGHGRLARLLAGPAADVVRDALRLAVPGDPVATRRRSRSRWPRASCATARGASARS